MLKVKLIRLSMRPTGWWYGTATYPHNARKYPLVPLIVMQASAEPQRPSLTACTTGCMSVTPRKITSIFQSLHNPSSPLSFYPDDSKPPFQYWAEREYPPFLDGEQLALPQDGMFYWWTCLHYGLTSLASRPLRLPPPQLQRDISLNAALRMSRSLRREFGYLRWNPFEPKWCA